MTRILAYRQHGMYPNQERMQALRADKKAKNWSGSRSKDVFWDSQRAHVLQEFEIRDVAGVC